VILCLFTFVTSEFCISVFFDRKPRRVFTIRLAKCRCMFLCFGFVLVLVFDVLLFFLMECLKTWRLEFAQLVLIIFAIVSFCVKQIVFVFCVLCVYVLCLCFVWSMCLYSIVGVMGQSPSCFVSYYNSVVSFYHSFRHTRHKT